MYMSPCIYFASSVQGIEILASNSLINIFTTVPLLGSFPHTCAGNICVKIYPYLFRLKFVQRALRGLVQQSFACPRGVVRYDAAPGRLRGHNDSMPSKSDCQWQPSCWIPLRSEATTSWGRRDASSHAILPTWLHRPNRRCGLLVGLRKELPWLVALVRCLVRMRMRTTR